MKCTLFSPLGLALLLPALLASSARSAPPTCLIVNLTSGGGVSRSLQVAQDAANPGDTLKVKGTCSGAMITKSLSIVGQSNPAFGAATLTQRPPLVKDYITVGGVLDIESGTVVLNDLTVSGGEVCAFEGRGGGIHAASGTDVTLNNTDVTGNAACGESTGGGGIYNAGTLTLNSSSVSLNRASRANNPTLGGGIDNHLGTLTLNDSVVTGNLAGGSWGGNGGGIINDAVGGTVVLNHSSVSGNSVTPSPFPTQPPGAGGIHNLGASNSVTLVDTSITGNGNPQCINVLGC